MAKSRIKILLWVIINFLLYLFFGKNIIFLIITGIINYFWGLLLDKKKNIFFVVFAILCNLLPLLFFKYITFIVNYNVLVPLGISYYTLSFISYLVDVYENRYPSETDFLKYCFYVFYFPSLFIGPINRYQNIKKQMENFCLKKENIFPSLFRILIGLIKKIVIANSLSVIIGNLSSDLSYQGLYVLFGALIYFVMLYCDFSGGIDLVLGVSKLFNIDLVENFDQPFLSESVKEFWRRWHISLGNCLKDYIYIPLGGNRNGKWKTKINVLITFIISGLWHGIHYILWGVINGIFVCFEWKSKNKYLNRTLTFLLISLLWIFFIYQDTLVSLEMFLSIFTKSDLSFFQNIFRLGLNVWQYLISFFLFSFILWYENKKLIINNWLAKRKVEIKLIILLIFLLIVLLFGSYGLDVNSNNFIYGGF